MKITVLAGGLSPERDVSLVSGSLIARALTERGHKALLVDVYEGIDIKNTELDALFENADIPEYRITGAVPDLDAVRERNGGREALIGEGVLEVCAAADVVFIALHGAMGENGHVLPVLPLLLAQDFCVIVLKLRMRKWKAYENKYNYI